MASQVSKLFLNTKTTFEKLPGMKPRVDGKVEIFMEFLPESLQATEKFLEELVLVGHYTGTGVSLVDGEVLIEGSDHARVLFARDLLNHNIGLAVQSPVLGTSSASKKMKSSEPSTAGVPKKVESRCNSNSAETEEDDSEVSSTTDHNNPKLEVSAGKEVGEGHVIEVQELSDIPDKISLVTLKHQEENSSDAEAKSITEENLGIFNIILDKSVTLKGKSVVFADAFVENANSKIYDQVHEIKRHAKFVNANIFVPERQKKKISKTGKLKLSLRNKTDVTQDLSGGTVIGKISIESAPVEAPTHDTGPEQDQSNTHKLNVENHSLSKEALNKETVLIDTNPHVIKMIDVDDDDDDIQIVGGTIGGAEAAKEEKGVNVLEARSSSLKIQSAHLSTPTCNNKSSKSLNTTIPVVPIARINKKPCTHPVMEEEACKEALLTGGECKIVKCHTHRQHSFSQTFLHNLRQEFCMRHLRNGVCTRALPPFLCNSKQHADSPDPLLAFYRDHREAVFSACANCKLLPKTSVSKLVDEEKTKTLKETGEKNSLVATNLSEIIKEEDPEPCMTQQANKDHCAHIKFRMTLCKYRDKNKCTKSGCADVHAINEVLKIEFCRDYMENPAQCQSSDCLPHFSQDQLQEKYRLSIRARVLNCSKCIFRCKHFNTANLPNKKAKICDQDLASKCSNLQKGLCTFVHKEEVLHLNLPSDNAKYKTAFYQLLAGCKGFCKICKAEIGAQKSDFERRTGVEGYEPSKPSMAHQTHSKTAEGLPGGTSIRQHQTTSKSIHSEVPQPKRPHPEVTRTVQQVVPSAGAAATIKVGVGGPHVATKPSVSRVGPSQPSTQLTNQGQIRPSARGRCRIFWGGGNCRFGAKCRFHH